MYKKINELANYLMENSKKWNKKGFVLEQYTNHIEECSELSKSQDEHLQAELLDKAIIACIGNKLNMMSIEYERDMLELKKHICDYGIIEFKTIEELFQRRKEKFLSKLNLNGG